MRVAAVLSLLSGPGYRRVGAQSGKGPEWAGPCPVCGGGKGSDRFHVWPEQGESGTFWCRQCAKGGDLIEYYRWTENLSYREACDRAGVSAQSYNPESAPFRRGNGGPAASWQPAVTQDVIETWSEHAAKFAEWGHAKLVANTEQLAWLAGRGIDQGTVAQYGLGWNSTDTYRAREAWGLETVRKGDGKLKKLWFPAGLIIPQWIGQKVTRLRIRRPDVAAGELKYYVVPGSGREPLISRRDAIAYVVVESELDAMVVDGAAGDLIGVVAMGNASAKPTQDLHALFSAAVHLSISLDSDSPRINPVTGRTEAPGAQGSLWWLKQYRTADRVPVIGGKDPSDAYRAGVDIRAWVLAGLPPRFRLAAQRSAQAPAADAVVEQPAAAPQMDENEASVNHRILTLHDGREIHIVDSEEVWNQLVAEGSIVFSQNELNRLQAACSGLDEDGRQQAVRCAVDAKEVFSGAYIRRGEINMGDAK